MARGLPQAAEPPQTRQLVALRGARGEERGRAPSVVARHEAARGAERLQHVEDRRAAAAAGGAVHCSVAVRVASFDVRMRRTRGRQDAQTSDAAARRGPVHLGGQKRVAAEFIRRRGTLPMPAPLALRR